MQNCYVEKRVGSEKSFLKSALFITSLVILALWLPFGFSLTGLIEEWGMLGCFTKEHFFIADIQSPLAPHALRPLTIFPQAVAYWLDPNSFFYWHVLLIISLLLKGIVAGALIYTITGSYYWGLLTSILLIVYPADTMQLSFRALHINWSLALILLATYVFIKGYHCVIAWKQNIFAIIASIIMVFSLLMYETALSLVVLPFVLLYIQSGHSILKKMFQSNKILPICWFTGILFYFIYVIVISHKIATYQSQILGPGIYASLKLNAYKLFSPGLTYNLIQSWFYAFKLFLTTLSFWGYLYNSIIVFFVCAFLCLFYPKNDLLFNKINRTFPTPSTKRLAICGLILSILAYAPYLVSGAHVVVNQRTYLFAALGGTFFWLSILIGIAKYIKLTHTIIIILLFLGINAQLYQFKHYINLSNQQRQIIRNIVTNFNGELEDKTLILLDESNYLNKTWMFLKGYLTAALSYIYGHSLYSLEICYMPSGAWQSTDPVAPSGTCKKTNAAWVFNPPTKIAWPGYKTSPVTKKVIAKNNAIVLLIKPDGSVKPDSSAHHKSINNEVLALRYKNILLENKWQGKFQIMWKELPRNKYEWPPTKWWSLDMPFRGDGWREGAWTIDGFHKNLSFWKRNEKSTLLFDLTPSTSDYVLKGKFVSFINPAIKPSLKISINDYILDYHWLNEYKFKAIVPNKVLHKGVNTLAFISIIDNSYYNLSANFNSFKLYPVK